jgi:hypothetical protein
MGDEVGDGRVRVRDPADAVELSRADREMDTTPVAGVERDQQLCRDLRPSGEPAGTLDRPRPAPTEPRSEGCGPPAQVHTEMRGHVRVRRAHTAGPEPVAVGVEHVQHPPHAGGDRRHLGSRRVVRREQHPGEQLRVAPGPDQQVGQSLRRQ